MEGKGSLCTVIKKFNYLLLISVHLTFVYLVQMFTNGRQQIFASQQSDTALKPIQI